MKTRRTYRLVLLLITALVFSPILSSSMAYAMSQSSPVHQQSVTSSTSSKCHQNANSKSCNHCDAVSNNQCQHERGDNCDSSCGHSAATSINASQNIDVSFYYQDNLPIYIQLVTSIIIDTDLRPPQSI